MDYYTFLVIQDNMVIAMLRFEATAESENLIRNEADKWLRKRFGDADKNDLLEFFMKNRYFQYNLWSIQVMNNF